MISKLADLVYGEFSSFFYINSSELSFIILESREFQSFQDDYSCSLSFHGKLIIDLINYFLSSYIESNMEYILFECLLCWLLIANTHAKQMLCICATYYILNWYSFEFRRNALDVLHLYTIHEILNSSKSLWNIFHILLSWIQTFP